MAFFALLDAFSFNDVTLQPRSRSDKEEDLSGLILQIEKRSVQNQSRREPQKIFASSSFHFISKMFGTEEYVSRHSFKILNRSNDIPACENCIYASHWKWFNSILIINHRQRSISIWIHRILFYPLLLSFRFCNICSISFRIGLYSKPRNPRKFRVSRI